MSRHEDRVQMSEFVDRVREPQRETERPANKTPTLARLQGR